MATRLFTAVLLMGSALAADAQTNPPDTRPTIPEIAARNAPAPVLSGRISEGLIPLSIEALAAKADLIVRGMVERRESYLSADQGDMYTDYTLTPSRIFARRGAPAGASTLSAAETFTVKCWGGEMLINGVPVSLEDLNLPAFKSGQDVVLFLTYSATDKKFELAWGIEGAYVVNGNNAVSMIKNSQDILALQDLSDAIERSVSVAAP